MFRKGDIILYSVIIIAIAGALLYYGYYKNINSGTEKIAVIKHDDKIINRIDLDKVDKPYTLDVEGNFTDIVEVEKGRIRFQEANCPDKVCVKTGWLSKQGDAAMCLPNRVSVKIEGSSGLDSISY